MEEVKKKVETVVEKKAIVKKEKPKLEYVAVGQKGVIVISKGDGVCFVPGVTLNAAGDLA